MDRLLGTVSMGLRAPIINQGDDLVSIATSTLLKASELHHFKIEDRDILAITESVLARSQGNYVSTDQIAKDVAQKMGSRSFGLLFPILSRNRFAILLRGLAKAADQITIQLPYPADEVGNEVVARSRVPYGEDLTKVYTEEEFRTRFGRLEHPITKVDYPEYYRELCAEEGCRAEIIFANDPKVILDYQKHVISCDIHRREETKAYLQRVQPAATVYGLYEIMNAPVDGSGYNERYGLLGSNKASESKVKLFPREGQETVEEIQKRIFEKTGAKIEVMIYGDGAFCDPACQIWELADPVVSPFHTSGLKGTPHELKLKYLADDAYAGLSKEEQEAKIREAIRNKSVEETEGMAGEGTTPRQLTDLLGSLCDLTSGSGDKGTPMIFIKGYFDSYIA